MEKSCRERRFTRLPELPRASQLFIHFLTKRGESLVHEQQTVGSASRVTRRLVESLFFNGEVTLLAVPIQVNSVKAR